MGLDLHIPDSVARAIRLPEERQESELLVELAVSLYAAGLLSLGKASELAAMDRYEFGRVLNARQIPRHYGADELSEDLAYARGQ